MCGRFARYSAIDGLIDQLSFDLDMDSHTSLDWAANLPISYNIAPTLPVLTVGKSKPEFPFKLAMMRWGFVPFFTKAIDPKRTCHNARKETIQTSGMFKHSFNKRRCIVIGDGFYEWKTEGKVKTPYYFQVTDYPFMCFAGIWDKATIDGQTIISCAIVTTEPNLLVAPIHDRMPVILNRENFKLWCDPDKTGDDVFYLLKPYPPELMTAHQVSRDVSLRVDHPSCIVPANSQ